MKFSKKNIWFVSDTMLLIVSSLLIRHDPQKRSFEVINAKTISALEGHERAKTKTHCLCLERDLDQHRIIIRNFNENHQKGFWISWRWEISHRAPGRTARAPVVSKVTCTAESKHLSPDPH